MGPIAHLFLSFVTPNVAQCEPHVTAIQRCGCESLRHLIQLCLFARTAHNRDDRCSSYLWAMLLVIRAEQHYRALDRARSDSRHVVPAPLSSPTRPPFRLLFFSLWVLCLRFTTYYYVFIFFSAGCWVGVFSDPYLVYCSCFPCSFPIFVVRCLLGFAAHITGIR